MVQSDCYTLCDLWGGIVIKETSFSFAKRIAGIDN